MVLSVRTSLTSQTRARHRARRAVSARLARGVTVVATIVPVRAKTARQASTRRTRERPWTQRAATVHLAVLPKTMVRQRAMPVLKASSKRGAVRPTVMHARHAPRALIAQGAALTQAVLAPVRRGFLLQGGTWRQLRGNVLKLRDGPVPEPARSVYVQGVQGAVWAHSACTARTTARAAVNRALRVGSKTPVDRGTRCARTAIRARTRAGLATCKDCPHGKYEETGGKTKCNNCEPCPSGQVRAACGGTSHADSSGSCVDCADGAWKLARYAGNSTHRVFDGSLRAARLPSRRRRTASTAATASSSLRPARQRATIARRARQVSGALAVAWAVLAHARCALTARTRMLTTSGIPAARSAARKYGDVSSSHTGEHHCKNCPAGQYRDATGHTDCVPCAAGRYQSETGAMSCAKCPGGKFTPTASIHNSKCKSCAVGRFQPDDEQTSCKACAAGTYADIQKLQACKSCEVGRFNTASEQTDCINCDKGHYQSATGKTSARNALKATYSPTMVRPHATHAAVAHMRTRRA